MEEFRRFLRYVLPGLIFMLQILFYIFILDFELFHELINKFGKHVAVPFLVFLGSGGLGFFLGIFYHTIRFCLPQLFAINLLPLVKDASNRKLLKLKNSADGEEIKTNNLNRNDAWRIVTSFYYERLISSKRIKGADPRAHRIVDIIHGLGATFIGSILAFIFWLYIHYFIFSKGCPPTYFYCLPALFIGVSFFNFRCTVKDLESLVSIIMIDELEDELYQNGTKTIMNYPQRITWFKRLLTVIQSLYLLTGKFFRSLIGKLRRRKANPTKFQ